MATQTLEAPGRSEQQEGLQPYWQDAIEGRYRRLTVTQLTLYWWLYKDGHINARQLRAIFALHEMHERRSYLEKGAHCRYPLTEINRLIGGGGGEGSERATRRDVARLSKLGVVTYEANLLRFATSPDQLNSDLDLSGFWALLNAMPHKRRTVPVPRRLLRALAGGFSRAVAGTLIAHVIRCLFWHKAEGGYRVDGRTKASWVVDHFGISRRAVMDARKKLIGLGWLEKIEAEQWEINRWGGRYAIRTAGPGVDFVAESAPPQAANDPESAPLSKQISSSKEEALITRRPTSGGRSGHSIEGKEAGSRKKKGGQAGPTIFDIQRLDLELSSRTEMLYRDACKHGKASASEHGRLQFFALVERARAHGQDPCKLLAWLLREGKTGFIAQIDEDRSVERIKTLDHDVKPHRDRKRNARKSRKLSFSGEPTQPRVSGPSDDMRYYMAVLDAVRRTGAKLDEISKEACRRRGWTQERWDQAEADYWAWQKEKSEAVEANHLERMGA